MGAFGSSAESAKSEFVDNLTYSSVLGIAAKSGNICLGLGSGLGLGLGLGLVLNYTGTTNTDELGVNANTRYMI